MTHRQYLMWQLWLAQQWNLPDRSDHYSMRIAEELGKLRKDNLRTSGYYEPLESFKVPFIVGRQKTKQQPSVPEETPEQEDLAKDPVQRKLTPKDAPPNMNVHAVSVNAKAVWAARKQMWAQQAKEQKNNEQNKPKGK